MRVFDYPLFFVRPVPVPGAAPRHAAPRYATPRGVAKARPGAARVMQIAEPDEEAGLMAAFAAGQASAFETLYQRHKGGVYRYFLRSLTDSGLADELAQDVWTSLIRARDTYRAEAKFTTWLYRLAHNRLIDHYRRSSLVVFTALESESEEDEPSAPQPASTAPGPEDAASQRAAARRAVQLVEQLPPAQREALLMQLEGGLSLEDIAAATGQGFETVKSRLRYALAKLREGLKDHV